jgi:crotonobetainyl-CoA:carnitine CoA-transferase CaiB-like acyl-CoA transferase
LNRFPLEGLRALEIGTYLAGPYCGMQLADLGADVIKVEPPGGGDQMRFTEPLLDGESSTFLRLNRNKRSIVLDLKSPQGLEVFKRLIATADVVIENMRPGTMRDLGLDFAGVLQPLNPRLIYVAISGWGQTGPLAGLPGLDIMAQARSGLMSITGEPDRGPAKVGVPICDLVCGLYGTIAALAALNQRAQTGRGQLIDANLFESGVSLSVWEAGKYFATGEVPVRMGTAHQNSAPYQAVRSSDGAFTFGATTPRNWSAACQVFGLQDLEHDPQYRDSNARFKNRAQLIRSIEAVTQRETTAHWIEALNHAGVPCAPIQTYDQVYADPHLQARDYFWDAPHPVLGAVRQLGSPVRFSESAVRRATPAPRYGEHSRQILLELGYPPAQIEPLLAPLPSAPGK